MARSAPSVSTQAPLPPKPVLQTPAPVNLLDPERIWTAALAHGAPWDKDPAHCHLFYIEGCNLDGTPNDNAIDKWNDVRGILKFVEGKPQVVFACRATTEPGIFYDRIHVIGGPQGAALIWLGYQECWQVGIHHPGRAHEALVQTGGQCKVYRDFDKSFRRQDGHITTGDYGINQHSTGPGLESDPDSVGPWSAGCLVAEDYDDHVAWMKIVKSDNRYVADREHVFGTIVMPAAWVQQATGLPPTEPKPPAPSAPDKPAVIFPPRPAQPAPAARSWWQVLTDILVKWRSK